MQRNTSRGKKAAINTTFCLLEEFISVICGFILPRLMLAGFGSKYNGLTISITQFLSCAVLLRSGIGGATRAALYKPLAEENHNEINSIVKATDIFMKKIGVIMLGAIIAFAAIYPFMIKNEFGWLFTFSLFIIIGASSFAESFFGITYFIVLQADQKLWISSILKIICLILNTGIGAILILNGFSIHIVKLGSALIYVAYPIFLGMYVRHHYKIDLNVKPNTMAISQRWDAFWQQVAVFVMNNTDVIVLSVFTNMLEVSVYGVYNMVVSGLKKTINSFTNGLEAAFGNMIAKKEKDTLRENVSVIETILYGMSTVIFTCTAVLILDFVRIYTRGITDVNYNRPIFALVIIIAQFFNAVRIPYQLVVQAAGHYKQTKKGAIIEPIMNISLSIIFVFKFGLVGVAIGTMVATLFRTIQYSVYMSKFIVPRKIIIVVYRICVSFIEAIGSVLILNILHINDPMSYSQWFIKAIASFGITSIVVILGSVVFSKKDMVNVLKKIKGLIRS